MNNFKSTDIAIIGVAGQFPGAKNISEFWDNIKNGVESVSFFSDEELLNEGVPKDLINAASYVKANSFLNDKNYFDSAFFDYLPGEAKLMEPQIRLFHENCWHALEDAGYANRDLHIKTGLFAGGYLNNNWMSYVELLKSDDTDGFSTASLSHISHLCSRVSHALDLQGPSVYINTACSTSLVAVQKASASLLLRECDMALAGGVRINNFSKRGYVYKEGVISSKDGHCRPFDINASGTIGGEGVGVVVLKRLKDALDDNDNIYAIIKGSGINNDGAQKISYTAPSVEGQIKAITKALQMAKVEPESIGYIEAHGTGTLLGDPVEVEALNNSYDKSEIPYCALGSVKANIGHLDTAAGIAGLIKTVLVLKNKKIPPVINFSKINPKINLHGSPFYINTELKDWENDKYPLRAGITSLGVGGTNVHIILEEAPSRKTLSSGRAYQLLTVSARTPDALKRNIDNLRNYLEQNREVHLSDVAYTLNFCRTSFEYRRMLVCKNHNDCISELSSPGGAMESAITPVNKRKRSITFMFPGQGSQYMNMCVELFEHEEVFRTKAETCFEIIRRQSGKDIQSVLFSDIEGNINNTEYTQPALFIVEYALAHLLMSWGIQPDVMIGHSIGEYVAACLAGVFTLEDALNLVVKRGELMQKMERGSMLSILISAEELVPYLEKCMEVSLAAVNSSSSCVVSGPAVAISEFKELIEKQGFLSKELHTSHAFHSHMMDGVLVEFEETVNKVKISEPKIPFISNVTGKRATARDISDVKYWVNQLRNTVRFSEGIMDIMRDEHMLFVEVGPGRSLSSFVGANEHKKDGHKTISLLDQSKDGSDSLASVLTGVGKLWMNGAELDWSGFYKNEACHKLSFPGYAFERIKYPVDVDVRAMISEMISDKSTLKKDLPEWFYSPTWKLSAKIPSENIEDSEVCTLVFADPCGIGQAIVENFKQGSDRVICVRAGSGFTQEALDSYIVNPEDENGYQQLYERLKTNNLLPGRIVHCWGITDETKNISAENLFSQSKDLCFYSFVNVFKLSQLYKCNLKEITVLTSELHNIGSKEECLPDTVKSLSLGLVKVIGQEYPAITTSHIDISLTEKFDSSFQAKLFEEIRHPQPGKVVSYRQLCRWVQIYEKIEVDGKTFPPGFKQNGIYLVTGGLGGVGYTISKYLGRHFKAKLVLLGTMPLPHREEWAYFLNNEQSDKSIKEKIKQIKSIEEEGGEVLYMDCDISNKERLYEIVKISEKRYGALNGVFHSAGLTNGRSINSIDQLEKADFESQYTAKVSGVMALSEVLKDKDLDFCILTSSLASILGGLKFGAYSSANTFMDYFVQIHKRQGLLKNWISVNFDGINFGDEWSEVINYQELPDLLNYILNLKELPQLVVSTKELQPRLDNWISKKNFFDSNTQEADVKDTEDDIKDEGFTIVENKLIKVWKNFFGRHHVGIDDDFFEIGGDSLKALTLISRINKELNVNLLISVLFQKPSIRNLAAYIDAALPAGSISIEKANPKPFYHLSSAQQRLYFLYEFDKGSLAYNLPQIIELKGEVDKHRVEETFRRLINRHESLRTCIVSIDETAMQQIVDDVEFSIECFESEQADVDIIIDKFICAFDLSKAPLIRVGLIKISEESHLLMVDMHHIITDGVSQGILIKDFMALYNNEELPELRLQYKDYAEWQQGDKQLESIAAQLKFWKQEFSEKMGVLDLPTDFSRPIVKGYDGGGRPFSLGKEETKKLMAIGEQAGATLFMTVLSILNVLLSKLSNQEDICIGTPTAGRSHADVEGIIGMFVNTLALRNYPDGELTFKEFLLQVKTKAISCFENQSYQYEELIRELNLPRDTGRNPLFDVMFVFQNFDRVEFSIPGLTFRPHNNKSHSTSQFDLSLIAGEYQGELHLNFQYSTELFEAQTIDRFISYFRKIVTEVTRNTDKKLSQIDILLEQEHELLHKFNNTATDYPLYHTFINIFEEQVKKTPHATAAIDQVEEISYSDLNNRANQLAHALLSKDLVKEMPVVVLCDRSVNMLACILSIFKAGGTYIPLSAEFPITRIIEVFTDARAMFLITTSSILNEELLNALHATVPDLHVLCLDNLNDKEKLANKLYEQSPDRENGIHRNRIDFTDQGDWEKLPVVNPSVAIEPSNLAYILYTSGSTGVPKGVMIEHNGMLNHLFIKKEDLRLTSGSIVAQNASETFDISIWQFLSPLIAGGKTVIFSKELILEPKKFLDQVNERQITVLEVVPSYLTVLLTHLEEQLSTGTFSKLEYLLVTGETLHKPLVKKWFDLFPDIKMVNAYGPTEASDDITHCILEEVPASTTIPIGKALPNFKIYIVDKNMGLCPIGVKGEIVVSGIGVGRGYLNQPEKTAAVFMDDIFSLNKGVRMYRTGDIGRYLPDGNIEFFGRRDSQVKIRGYRIELGDIESHLMSYGNVEQAVVTFLENGGDKRLTAFLVPKDNAILNLFEIKKFLRSRLPEYMIPELIRKIDKLPLTNNGKVDLKALAGSIEKSTVSKAIRVQPRTDVEKYLLETWMDLLLIDEININDNFFDLGGHSLLLITANRRVNKKYSVELPLNIYYNTTLEQLAQEIEIKLKSLD